MPGKPKKACAKPGCGLTRNALVHVGSTWEHDFVDPRPSTWRRSKSAQLKAEPECALKDLDYGSCWNPGDKNDVNHVQPRGMGGTSYDDSPLVTLCRRHHDLIEENRELGRSLGLLQRRDG